MATGIYWMYPVLNKFYFYLILNECWWLQAYMEHLLPYIELAQPIQNGNFILAAITGTTILVPYLQIKSLQLIRTWGPADFIYRCPIFKSSPPNATYMGKRTRSSLVQVMVCCLFSAKPLPEPMLRYCQLDSWEQVSVKFEQEFYHFHSRKCIWKYCLPKWPPFCQGGDELNKLHRLHYMTVYQDCSPINSYHWHSQSNPSPPSHDYCVLGRRVTESHEEQFSLAKTVQFGREVIKTRHLIHW